MLTGVEFASIARRAMAAAGLSLRATARAAHFDVTHLSRVLNCHRPPSYALACALDDVLGTDEALRSLVPDPDAPPPSEAVQRIRDSVAALLRHDNEYGPNHVASAGVQVWKSAVRNMIVDDRNYVTAAAEAAQVAGWLLHGANRPAEAWRALTEALALAADIRDRPMMWFCKDLLAMAAIADQQPRDASALADSLLTDARVPHRVALMAHVRQARALAQSGDTVRASNTMARALGGFQDSDSDRDPQWTWWIDEGEVTHHHGLMLVDAGDARGALPYLDAGLSLALSTNPKRNRAKQYAVGYVGALVSVGAWRDAEEIITRHIAPLDYVSGRVALRWERTLALADRHGPAWFKDLASSVSI
ncbi:helix-turn-helix domain-containing protein [Streptomyces yaizuensis]|uniref:Helix-turn-helix transcriptional regulator n=1 Tax=Streptomyces yaizuensis TaxID=2989713 RepID=A0ABQ5NX52_9ACTN|nr:helix-turn-helix transcriptional regulator [Streptomyces sp. YSPA8]GLF94953.1 helix-turn-helix transcriptional regulator [Streptomyces sp. YSPA8]